MTDAQSLTMALGGRWYGRYGIAPCPVCQPERRKGQNALNLADGLETPTHVMTASVLEKMQRRIVEWGDQSDDRALFLSCYQMMSANMLAAIERGEFDDPPWVDNLLHRFAEYYFDALDAYERAPESAPRVWRFAHDVSADPSVSALQKMLLGVSAHINYDLVLALVDVLEPEWPDLTESRRGCRYSDHCRVNSVIGATVDVVQNELLSPAMPAMGIIDRLMGPFDEMAIARLLTRWRETVWSNARAVLDAEDPRHEILRVELTAIRTARIVCPQSAGLLRR